MWKSKRYFVERIIQDAKSESGWAELEARKYSAWMHHTALTALALWFLVEVKLEYQQDCQRDEGLKRDFALEELPALSAANVRELLRVVMPLKALSVQDAIMIVVNHLVNRSRSTASRTRRKTVLKPSNTSVNTEVLLT